MVGGKAISKSIDGVYKCQRNIVKGSFRDDGGGPCKAFETGGNNSPL